MKCLYHGADLDGHCSGAIVKYFNPECEMIPMNYGDEIPKFKPHEDVVIVDFSLPFRAMEFLDQYNNLVWIDHHKTAIEDMERLNISGKRELGRGACELTWEYFSNEPVPEGVWLLSLYDVWDHKMPDVLAFQYGMRMREDTSPDNQSMWGDVFTSLPSFMDETLLAGTTIMKYEETQNKKYCDNCAFVLFFEGLRFLAMNKPLSNSKVVDSLYRPERHDAVMFFWFQHGRGWNVSMFSDKADIDVGEIAKRYGGGGHKGAAGFIIKTLFPLKIPC